MTSMTPITGRDQPESDCHHVLTLEREGPLRKSIDSWSFPAAMRLPVNVRKPRMISTMMAVVGNAVRFCGCSRYHR